MIIVQALKTLRAIVALACANLVFAQAQAVELASIELAGVHYLHVICDSEELELWWKGEGGEVSRTFSNVEEELRKQGKSALFMMNGGIFEPGGVPSGLLVIDGKQLRPVNLANKAGNFFLKPNGVFLVSENGAGVMESSVYLRVKPNAKNAVQSGPMLLIDSKTHPAFRERSKNLLHRNGVGVDTNGRVHFLMTDLRKDARVNLWGFANAFRLLGCSNALFLDGDISQCYVKGATGKLESNRFGSIFVVSKSLEKAEK